MLSAFPDGTGQVRSKHPDLLTSLARHTDMWDLCLAGVPDSSGNSYKPEVTGQGFWLTKLTQRRPLTRLTARQSLSDQSALQYSQRNSAQTENSWLISHLKIISGCMLSWLNEKIRIPHSNWSPYCEYQMETFWNLPGFHRITPPLFREKKKSIYTAFSSRIFSLADIVFKIVVQTLDILVDTMVGKIKKKKRPVILTSNLQTGNEKLQMLFELTAELTAFVVLFPQNIYADATLYVRRKSHFLTLPHTKTCMCEKGKRRLR